MNGRTPHIIQYQGSKRILAPKILECMPKCFKRCVEPFCGTAAVSIAVAKSKNVNNFWLNDLNEPLVRMLQEAIEKPINLYNNYQKVWNEQFALGSTEHFFNMRNEFNSGNKTPENMLYLLARCVKGSVRYNDKGELNQACDKRRHGTKPETILKNVLAVSELLKGCTEFTALDYKKVLEKTQPGDIVYMDPPYQGTSSNHDRRYLAGVDYEDFVMSLRMLNKRGIDFLISYDGRCGNKEYGRDLPSSLECRKLMLCAGKSTQATLLGRKMMTYEALYVSKGLQYLIPDIYDMELYWEDVI